jgi:RNA polymerase sigma-70 factor (ECF subfamily)
VSLLSTKISDQEIAEGLSQGSPDAFRALYEALGSGVFAYLIRLTGRKEMAEELAQETFLTAIRKIGFFRAGPDGGLKAWVFRIATNLAIDSLRREKKMESPSREMADSILNQEDDRPGPQEELERFQFSQVLSLALQELTPAQRMIFLLKEQEGMSLLEISRVCGGSENSIKQSLFRARAALRRKLNE